MHKYFCALLVLSCFWSCDKTAAFHEYKSLPKYWKSDSAVTLKVDNLDTLSTYNAFITLRNDNSYAFSNVFLIASMQFPNGKTITDTLEYKMANPDGSWLGTGFGDIKENKLWYKEHIQFSEAGSYTFKLKQAMRRNGDVNPIADLEGIRDVGLRIEKTNE
ncbi:MAG TPA: gliding motility lipoprotein GldH [Leeuwenhoekiella sp.]|uniref:gliding motility lipoprotein GldH n=1 Tax=Leeuwenhoekiella palythoae TaxID=573501 RepID=UPI000E8935C2|nr:gliding motility lipoprotein GldH [Leeuwenhoekiella palythoae]UBZ11821.1 gliding motility lipoprotein GldH [Leeuwenhoekiella palythoae]HAX15796.1 gliding motility lipoprotein GldH [Leeuwenhoekiella sp.]HBO30740.1 gliding motility lipoprotein GldH [Leeuwenhoekiella sp.]HCQ76249.1 gliding motility lipoprotein GldH [Leeuwenhoekiella sp.]|tara:strand:+ start:515 stop:997 length:483 start_codon:yes stop_codon:yes gene_type:complete